jgi:Fatty acid desaturase
VHLDDLILTDPVYRPKAAYGRFDRFFLSLINDARDLPFAHFIVEASLILVPFAIYLFVGTFRWVFAAAYLPITIGWFMDRFILILHNTSHRPLFRPKYRILNSYIPWVLGPFFGETPETYFVHHIGMHHREANLEADLSTTMPFCRDSIVAWVGYFLRFFFVGLVELSTYMARKGRRKLLTRMIVGEASFYLFAAAACFVNWRATLVVFIIPFLFCRFIMMAGNWGQHAFIDSTRPGDSFLNSITVVNCRYNRRSFNDGYHIGHHRKATRHWTEMPVEFDQDRALYAKNKSIIFHGIDFTVVWLYLMLKRYDLLAKKLVDTQTPRRSESEIIAFLKERTRPIARAAIAENAEPAE